MAGYEKIFQRLSARAYLSDEAKVLGHVRDEDQLDDACPDGPLLLDRKVLHDVLQSTV